MTATPPVNVTVLQALLLSEEQEVTSTSYPYDNFDLAVEKVLNPVDILPSKLNKDVYTTTWNIVCSYCDFTRTNKESVYRHIRRVHPSWPLKVTKYIE